MIKAICIFSNILQKIIFLFLIIFLQQKCFCMETGYVVEEFCDDRLIFDQQNMKFRADVLMKMLKKMVKHRAILRNAVRLLEDKKIKLLEDEKVLIEIFKTLNKKISHAKYCDINYINFYKRLDRILQKWSYLEREKHFDDKKYWHIKSSTVKEFCVGSVLLVIIGLISFFA